MSDAKVIFANVFDPTQPSIFGKSKASKPARATTVTCSCESCPLLSQKQCVMLRILGDNCPYGTRRTESGPTRRAAKFHSWISERRKRSVSKVTNPPPQKLTFIGDYVFLPYSHANMCTAVPFGKHSTGFNSGSDFMKREYWTLANLLKLIDFRPQALFGGEISSYQKESVPLLIQHVREVDGEMWSQLIAARPQYDVAPNYVGRKALVRTLAYPITIPAKDSRYPVSWAWDGQKLTTTSVNAYSDTWGGVKPESLIMELAPDERAEVVVKDNSWVTSETVFVN